MDNAGPNQNSTLTNDVYFATTNNFLNKVKLGRTWKLMYLEQPKTQERQRQTTQNTGGLLPENRRRKLRNRISLEVISRTAKQSNLRENHLKSIQRNLKEDYDIAQL